MSGGTLVTDVTSGQPQLRRLVVEVKTGERRGEKRVLEQGSLIVGKDPEVDLALPDPSASRRHLELSLVGDGVVVRDLGSKNGTLLDDARIERAIISRPCELRVGETTLALLFDDTPVQLPRAATLGQLRTQSAAMGELFAILQQAAQSDASVLLEGETGVGKDVLARAIHEASPRKTGPFIVLDCGAISPTLIAGELFGHKKGAFTGAASDRVGVFEAARGGTVFLDEIGELEPELQPSLLRVLESRQVRRVGENVARDIDVRIVAATNRDLSAESEQGRFRLDLFFRLAIIRLRVPPLRERLDDVPALIDHFLAAFGRPPSAVSAADRAALCAHDWPGNVRELKNLVERACALSGDGPVRLRPPASPVGAMATPAPASEKGAPFAVADLLEMPLKQARDALGDRFERAYLLHLLAAHEGNVSAAARRAGVARNYVHRLLKKHGLTRSASFAPSPRSGS